MNTLSRKISDLEKNVISDDPKPEDTYLGTNNKNEIELFKRANQIQEAQKQRVIELEEKMKANPTVDYTADLKAALELSTEDQAIVEQANFIYYQRVMHLFDNAVAQHCHLNSPMEKYIFYTRLNWFLSEMKEWLYLLWKEHEITSQPGFFDLCAGEQEQKLKEVYDNWREWFSKESFYRYSERHHLTKSMEEIQQELANRTPDQIAKDEIEEQKEQEEDRKWEEQDKRYLKEKCPTCPTKCKWYNKQTQKEKSTGAK